MIRQMIAASLLAGAAMPAWAETIPVAAGEGGQERLQEALILAKPGDEVVLGAGRFVLTDGLSLDVDGVTVRGAGMDQTILDYTAQQGSGEGLLVTSDNVTLRDFVMENPKGDGVKSKGADNIVYHRVRVAWTGGPLSTNGAYGIYPVESTGVLIDGVQVSGASDAGIYVGQSQYITVRNSIAEANVAGIEIENSRSALVENNVVTRNTGGILVFDLPNLPVMGGGDVVVRGNLVVANDTPNFAPPGNIVASVPRGTGVLIMANDNVYVGQNRFADNPTAHVMVVAYPMPFDDPNYNPYPRSVSVEHNSYQGGGDDPQLDGGSALAQAFGGALPPVVWDGLQDGDKVALRAVQNALGLSLNLPEQGKGMAGANPTPLKVEQPGKFDAGGMRAPDELDARLK